MSDSSAGVRAFKTIEAAGLFPPNLTHEDLIDLASLIVGAYLRSSPPETAATIFEEAAAFTQSYLRKVQECDNV